MCVGNHMMVSWSNSTSQNVWSKLDSFQGYIPPNVQPAITGDLSGVLHSWPARRLPKGYAPAERQISHVGIQQGYYTVPMGCGEAALALCSTLGPPGLCYSTQLGPCSKAPKGMISAHKGTFLRSGRPCLLAHPTPCQFEHPRRHRTGLMGRDRQV